jgi:hypothetical protein
MYCILKLKYKYKMNITTRNGVFLDAKCNQKLKSIKTSFDENVLKYLGLPDFELIRGNKIDLSASNLVSQPLYNLVNISLNKREDFIKKMSPNSLTHDNYLKSITEFEFYHQYEFIMLETYFNIKLSRDLYFELFLV